MPQFRATLSDGRTVTLEADKAPTEQQILSAIKGYSAPKQSELDQVPQDAGMSTDPFSLGPSNTADVPASVPAEVPKPSQDERRAQLEQEKRDLAQRVTGSAFADKAIEALTQGTKFISKLDPFKLALDLPHAVFTETGLLPTETQKPSETPIIPKESVKDFLKQSIPRELGGGEIPSNDPVGQGVQDFISEFTSSASTPESLLKVATGRPGLRTIQTEMAASIPGTVQRIEDAAGKGDQAGVVKESLNLAASVAGPAAIERGIQKGETPNAIQERSTTPVPVEKPSGDSAEVGARVPEPETVAAPQASEVANVPKEQVARAPQPAPPPTPGQGLAKDVRAKWASATADEPFGSEAGFINLEPLKDLVSKVGPAVRASIDAVRELGKEQMGIRKVTDYGKSVMNWSAKLQRSFGEAAEAQKEIESKVPDPIKRDGITNWIQAGGDAAVLQSRLAATTDPKLRRGYEAALNLTPEELAVANDVKGAFDALLNRGMLWDVIRSFRDNYVTQIWDLGKGPTGGNAARTLKDNFRFSKARTFDSYFDGEQAGFIPKTKDISKILPMYLHEMNSVIAARQLVAEMAKGKAEDGRPLLAPRGAGVPIEDTTTGDRSTLVFPKAVKGDTSDYKVLANQPALNDWRWVDTVKSPMGGENPVLMKSDLAIHPEAYDKIKAALGKSAIREWYNSKGSVAAEIPKALAKGLDRVQSGIKQMMLGFFAPFHQVQEGTHAIGHRVSPVMNIPKIDLVRDAGQMDAAKHGVMLLPDRASADSFIEGFKTAGWLGKLPVLGPAVEWYQHYLFHEYIPGLKYKTYQAILERNTKVYESELAAGSVSPSDIKALSAEQTNAAYGHLNYSALGRDPTIRHLAQLALLAPDFLEARGRFLIQSIKGATGAKVGREQLLALGTLAIAQAAGAFTAAHLTGGEWSPSHPFDFTKGNRKYTMRSVPEDSYRMIADARAFWYNRLNPLIGRGAIQLGSGVDWRKRPVTTGETLKELAQQPVPLTLRPLTGLGNSNLEWWEQLASSLGLKIMRYSPSSDVRTLAQDWKLNSGDKKLVEEAERDKKTVNADSAYKGLRDALEINDLNKAGEEYKKLLETHKADVISRTMKPYTEAKIPGSDMYETHDKPFTGNRAAEQAFVKSLSSDQKKTYEAAMKERREIYKRFQQMLNNQGKR